MPWDFVSLNVLYREFREIFSEPGGISPSETGKKSICQGEPTVVVAKNLKNRKVSDGIFDLYHWLNPLTVSF